MYIESKYSSVPDLEILARENAIECAVCEKEIMEDISMLGEIIFFESGNDDINEKEESIIAKIGKAIREMIEKVTTFVSRLFKSLGSTFGEQLSVSDYMGSESVEIRLQEDLDHTYNETKKQIEDGHKILKKISSTTGIEFDEVQNWYDKVSNFVIQKSGTVLTTAATVAIANKLTNSLSSTKELQDQIKTDTERFEYIRGERNKRKQKETREEIESHLRKAEIEGGIGHKKKYKKEKKEANRKTRMLELQKMASGAGVLARRLSTAYAQAKRALDSAKTIRNKQEKRKRKLDRKIK